MLRAFLYKENTVMN